MEAVLTERETVAESLPDVQMEPASESRVTNAAQIPAISGEHSAGCVREPDRPAKKGGTADEFRSLLWGFP